MSRASEDIEVLLQPYSQSLAAMNLINLLSYIAEFIERSCSIEEVGS